MTFANPLGLLGLLSLPVIVAIHLYHRRYPVLEVAGLHLWGVETEVRSPGRTRERLPITASLLLELLAALLLSLLLARPQFGAVTSLRHLVVVLDNSASMSTTIPGKGSVRDAAVRLIEERMQALGRRGAVTVLLTGPRPTMLAGPAVSWEKAAPLLKDWQPRLAHHEFGSAWDLAGQLAERATELLFVTDRLPSEETLMPARMECVALGQPMPNVAFSAARWTFDSASGKGQVFLRVDNHSARPTDVEIVGRAGERDVFRRQLALDGKQSLPLEAEIPGGLSKLTIQAKSNTDGLALDSEVVLIEPQVRMVHFALTLPKDDPATEFFLRVLKSLPDVQSSESDKAQLLIGPGGELPPSRRDLWWFGIGPLDRSESALKAAVDLADRTPYLIDKRHPLLNSVTLGGIVWAGVQPTPFDGLPLISAGSHKLLLQLSGTQTTAFLMNIDLGRSNLSESPDWPILLSNLTELRRDNLPGLRQWNFRLNERIRFRLFEGDSSAQQSELQLWHEGESRPVARASMVELPPLDDVGVYEVRDGENVVGTFAVNYFDPVESDLTALESGQRAPTIADDSQGFDLDNPYSWALMLGLVLILAAALANWRILKSPMAS